MKNSIAHNFNLVQPILKVLVSNDFPLRVETIIFRRFPYEINRFRDISKNRFFRFSKFSCSFLRYKNQYFSARKSNRSKHSKIIFYNWTCETIKSKNCAKKSTCIKNLAEGLKPFL